MSDQAPSRVPTTWNTSTPTPASDNSLAWSDMRLLGFTPMDDVYEEFHTPALKLVTCSDASATDVIERSEQHVINHLEQGDEWACSTNFPLRNCHPAEHMAVLKSAGDAKQAMTLGETGADVVRSLEMTLFDWFLTHADYLDSAPVAWTTKQTAGGKPTVLHRTLAWIGSRTHPHFEGSALRGRGAI